MGLVHTSLGLKNPKNGGKNIYQADALVDTGALHLCIPEHVAFQLGLEELEKREVTTVDGKPHLCPYVGPIEINFDSHRSCYTGALVLGDEVLLGAVPMEDMDLVVIPSLRKVVPNPKNPNIPASVAKGLRE
jgi:clan AA aspartic protease